MLPDQGRAEPGSPGGEHAVVHVHAEGGTHDQVQGEPHPHQVPRLVLRQLIRGDVDHLPEVVLGLATTQASNGEPGSVPFYQLPGTVPPLVCIQSPLDDREKVLLVWSEVNQV